LIAKKYKNGITITVPYGTPAAVPNIPFVSGAAITVQPNPVVP
jgi:mannose-6-phosphate isomerase-like protein (cupin superfamily)